MRLCEFISLDEVEELSWVSKSKRHGYGGPKKLKDLQERFNLKKLLDVGNFSIWSTKNRGDKIYYIIDNRTQTAQIQLTCTERNNVLTNLNLFAAPGNTIKAADFYRLLITKLDKVLVAAHQSPGSQAVWAKLAKFPDVGVHGWLHGKPVNITPQDRDYAYATSDQSYASPELKAAHDMKLVAHKKDALEEDWRNWVTGLGAASMLAGGGSAAYDAYRASQEPQAQVKQTKAPQAKVQSPQAKSNAELAQQAQKVLSDPDAQLLTKVATAAGIKGTELAQFLAQTAHESANFTTTKEFGDKNYFKKYDIRHNPAKAKVLGNVKPGDGERYKGRGYIQLTGRENYRNAGKALGLPLEQRPELAERPEIAAKIAVWFWQNRVQPQVSNFNDTAQATKPINPAMNGLQDRRDKFAGMKVAMAKPTTLVKTATAAPAAKTAKPVVKPVKIASVKPTKVKRG